MSSIIASVLGPASVQCWPLLWSLPLPTQRRSDRGAISLPGLGSCQKHSSGGKDRLGHISKQGDRYLRSLFVAGALAVIRYAKSMAPNIGAGGVQKNVPCFLQCFC